MNNCERKTLALMTSLLNNADACRGNFYDSLLENLSTILKFNFAGVYFINDDEFYRVSQRTNDDIIPLVLDKELSKKIIECENHTYETQIDDSNYGFLTISKLLIKNSLYGLILLKSKAKYSESELSSFAAFCAIASYLIKDYELNDVFKMQLKALQDAIAEKNSAYEVIEKQHKKLIELDKTKNAFLANISHELRTPLNAIIGFSQALGCKIFGELNPKQEEYIKDIQISSLHLLGMINEILDLSKIESKAMKASLMELDPGVVIQEAINILTPLSEQKSISVNFINTCKGNIISDYQKLQQILYNLLSNAIKFTPDNGKIEIRISNENKDFILEVQDNGVGIDKKYHNKIFTKFVHLNNIYVKNQSSTGLGLTITKELVKLLKGKITLESTINKGTTFKVVLKGALI